MKNTNAIVSSRRRGWSKPFFEFHFFSILKSNFKKHAFFNIVPTSKTSTPEDSPPSRRTQIFKIIFNECSEMDLVQISRQMSK